MIASFSLNKNEVSNIFFEEIKNNAKAVVPIALLVLILNFFVGVKSILLVNFLLGCVGVILGLAVFLTGVELSISKIGSIMGEFLARFNSIISVIIFGVFIGFVISVAEPDLLILANEITSAVGLSTQLIVMIMSLGVGIMISIGLFRIFKEIKLSSLMIGIYSIIFILMIFADNFGHAIAFDASGATTGAMTTPFIISLGLGVASLKGDLSEDDSFGLVGIASAGPIIAGILMSLSIGNTNVEIAEAGHSSTLLSGITNASFARIPITLVFYLMNYKYFKMSKDEIKEISIGLLYSYIGLILFLSSVEGGFMELARVM